MVDPGPKPIGGSVLIAGTGHFALEGAHASLVGTHTPPEKLPDIDLLLQQAVVQRGAKTTDGHIVEAVTLPWFEIIAALQRDPQLRFKMPWEIWEDLVAGAYRLAGLEEVTITPRSRDHGRDVIATKYGLGTIRVIESVKRYGPQSRWIR